MSSKDCGHHGDRRKKKIKRCCCGLLIVLFIQFLIVLLIWAILQPKEPRFILQDATVYAFNVSSQSPNFLTINLQVTISSRNPMSNIGIYYDRLDVYATYRSQQITYRTRIPPTYQGHKAVDVWSPFVNANAVPISPYNGLALTQEQSAGQVLLKIKIDGRVRWKVGTFVTGKYHLYVECPAYITFGNRNTGIVVGDAIKYQLVQKCSVSV